MQTLQSSAYTKPFNLQIYEYVVVDAVDGKIDNDDGGNSSVQNDGTFLHDEVPHLPSRDKGCFKIHVICHMEIGPLTSTLERT